MVIISLHRIDKIHSIHRRIDNVHQHCLQSIFPCMSEPAPAHILIIFLEGRLAIAFLVIFSIVCNYNHGKHSVGHSPDSAARRVKPACKLPGVVRCGYSLGREGMIGVSSIVGMACRASYGPLASEPFSTRSRRNTRSLLFPSLPKSYRILIHPQPLPTFQYLP